MAVRAIQRLWMDPQTKMSACAVFLQTADPTLHIDGEICAVATAVAHTDSVEAWVPTRIARKTYLYCKASLPVWVVQPTDGDIAMCACWSVASSQTPRVMRVSKHAHRLVLSQHRLLNTSLYMHSVLFLSMSTQAYQ